MMHTFGGATALMYACQQCKEVEVLQILRKQPYSVKDRDRTLKTPLHYCAENPNPSCAEVLLKTAPELVNAQDENGYCTLHLAVIAGNKPLIKLLITKGADVNLHDNEGHSAVHWAIVSSEKEALEMIIRAGANPSTPDIHGGYPLHYAVQMCGSNCDYVNNAVDIIRVVETLINFGVDVNVKDKDGRQPILWAASAGSADAVVYLVSSGACVEAADKDGLTALHCAASRGHTTTLETLISLCGANVDLIDGNGCSAIFYSVTLGHADATELLLQLGADPNRQDRKGRTPAHCGAAKGQLETLRILQKHGGNLWMRNVKGDIPLHEAVASGRKDLVLWLLSQNTEAINIANNDGRCPLHIASMYNNTEMVKVLLDSKSLVNPVMRTHKGILMTPLNVALCKGHRSCGKYLQLHGGVPFSKVSKVEPEPVFAVRVSPSDDMMTQAIEKKKENLTSSPSKILKGRSSTDIQRNQDVIKLENIDKKKVYRRRKKKKSPCNKSTQDSDSEDSHHSIKANAAVGRKSEKSNEEKNDEENDEDEEKMKVKKVQLDTQIIKKEKNSKNSSFNRKITPTKKNKISEDTATDKSLTKVKTESKLQRNKSFNETKNVSDLSPEDFPPLMQAVNQLDSVIMEADLEISKSENYDGELRPQGVALVDLNNDIDPAEIKNEQEILEKINADVKATSSVVLSEKDLKENTLKFQDVEVVKKEDLFSQEQLCLNACAKNIQQNGEIGENEMSAEYVELKNSNDEGSLEKYVKSPESLANENFVEKDSKTGRINDTSDNKEKNEKAVIPTSAKIKETSPIEINFRDAEADELVNSKAEIDKEVGETEKLMNKTDVKGTKYFNDTKQKKVDSGVDNLPKEGTKAEVFVENKVEREVEKIPNSEANDLGSSSQKEESASYFSKNVIVSHREEDIGPPESQTVEEIKTVCENEALVISNRQREAEISPFEINGFSDNETSKDLDAFGITENVEKSSGDDFVLETLKAQSNPHETEKKPLRITEQANKENISQPECKRLVDVKENLEVEVEQSTILNTKDKDEVNQKTEDSVSNGKGMRRPVSETMKNYEDSESRDDKIPQKPNSSEHKQFKTPKVSRLCRRNRDFKEDFSQISVTQLVQNTIRKYHMERGIFYQLLELKRYQIRSGRANEQVLVKRLADEYERSRVFLGMKPFSGLYKFREFEKFLYDQLKALNARRSLIIPDIKSYDDIDALSGFLKKSRYKIISEIPHADMACTCITQRCHHSACAYTSVPCSAYVTDLRRQKHQKPKRECFFPRIHQSPPLKVESQKFKELPATLELVQGSEKHVITLPQSSPPGGKRYYVTFTIKGAPAFKEEDFVEVSKDYFKHRHAKSV